MVPYSYAALLVIDPLLPEKVAPAGVLTLFFIPAGLAYGRPDLYDLFFLLKNGAGPKRKERGQDHDCEL